MEDKGLDRIIRERLEQLDVPDRAGSWEQLAERMGEKVDASKQFDKAVRQKLDQQEQVIMAYPVDWDVFAKKLEAIELRQQLYRSKAVEFCMLLLILVTIGQLIPLREAFQLETNAIQVEKNIPSSLASTTISAKESLSNRPCIDTQIATKDERTYSTVNSDDQLAEANVYVAVAPIIERNFNAVGDLEDRELHQLKSTTQQAAVIRIEPSSSVTELEEALLLLEHSASIEDLPVEAKRARHKPLFRVGMYMATNIDHIQTPYDPIFNYEAYDRLVVGYTGGFSLGIKHRRWEVETGFAYSHKGYSPILNTVKNGSIDSDYFLEGVEGIELNTFEIPLQVAYDIIAKNRWRVYTAGGGALHTATQANYDVSRLNIDQLGLQLSNDISNDDVKRLFSAYGTPSEPISDKLNQKKFTDGWLSGGSFKDNSYLTLDMSVGVERHLNAWSIFMQPRYQRELSLNRRKGIGPNNDHISTLSVIFGLKTNL